MIRTGLPTKYLKDSGKFKSCALYGTLYNIHTYSLVIGTTINWKTLVSEHIVRVIIILCRLWLIADIGRRMEMRSRDIINCRVAVHWGLIGVRVFRLHAVRGWGFKRFTGTIKQSINKSGFFFLFSHFFFIIYFILSSLTAVSNDRG